MISCISVFIFFTAELVCGDSLYSAIRCLAFIFVIIPGFIDNSLKVALLIADLYGLITNAAHDLINLGTLKN